MNTSKEQHKTWSEDTWQIEARDGDRKYFIADVYGRTEAQRTANARLIVASVNHAEALAEALREMISFVDDLGVTTSTTRDKAREALAAWEGFLGMLIGDS